jgi:RNA processing factor Prp31
MLTRFLFEDMFFSLLFFSSLFIHTRTHTHIQVLLGARTSMGMDVSEGDLVNINSFATRVKDLLEYRTGLYSYLQDKMDVVAPNLKELIGDVVAARLISHAGSLTNLAKAPASTVQILGAEKVRSLFFFTLHTHTHTSLSDKWISGALFDTAVRGTN